MKIGYARISTKDKQTVDMQIVALKAAGVEEENIFIDKGISGSKISRPELDRMLEFIRKGDTLYVFKIDRISRSTMHLLELSQLFKEKGVDFISLNDPIDTTTPMGKAFYTIMAAVAELERDLIRSRVISGIEASRMKGNVKFGRPTVDSEKIKEAMELKKLGYSTKKIKERTGIAKSTLYKYLSNQKQKELSGKTE